MDKATHQVRRRRQLLFMTMTLHPWVPWTSLTDNENSRRKVSESGLVECMTFGKDRRWREERVNFSATRHAVNACFEHVPQTSSSEVRTLDARSSFLLNIDDFRGSKGL